MDMISLRKAYSFRRFREALEANFEQILAALDASDGYLPASYLGAVSNLGRAADNLATDHTVSMAVTTRTAQDDISAAQVMHHNWYSNASNTSERLPGGACTYTDWLEYPIGVAYYGGASVTAPNGEKAVNDLGTLGVTIPAGAKFRVWTKRVGAQVFTGGRGSWHLGAGYLANPASGEQVPQLNHVFYPGAAWVNTYWPTVLGQTQRRSVLFIDDSHGMGEGERGEPDLGGFYGMLERYFSDRCGWTNMSTRGMSLQSFISSHSQRQLIGQYYSDIYIGLGGNDVSAGRTSGQMLADLDTIIGYYPGKSFLSGTELPKTTSTDSWATTANQTPISQEGVSRDFSRAKMYGTRFKRVYDWTKGASFFRTDGSIVHKPGITADGNHLTADGYAMAAAGERQSPLFY